MNKRYTDNKGFTLVELIVSIGIISLLSVIALPRFFSNWEDERLNASAKITAAWLDDLRRKAIQTSVPCQATWNLSAASISAQCDNESSISSTLNLKAEIENTDNLEIGLRPNDPTTWIFTPRGTSTTDGLATFTLTNSNSDPGRCLHVTAPLGLIRLAKKTPANSCDYTTAY